MRWSKLKKEIESGFADSVQGRVEVWTTRYRGAHDQEGEGWMTVDKVRVHSMGSLTHMIDFYRRVEEIRIEEDCEDYHDPADQVGYYGAIDVVDDALQSEGAIGLRDFNAALFDYLNLSIEDILKSDRAIIRAVGMFDRRVGKRRLKVLAEVEETDLVRRFFQLRCAFEGISLKPH